MSKKLMTAAAAIVVFFTCAYAREEAPRKLLQRNYSQIENKAETFKSGRRWLPYPDYTDRQAWDQLTGKHKASLIKNGEKALSKGIVLIKASEYLEFEKDGKVSHTYSTKANISTLGQLILAELAEGKGRFIPALVDALYYMAERSSWQSPFHQKGRMTSKRTLPDPDERCISLNSASMGRTVAEALYFFKDEFDKIDPVISKVILNSLRANIYEPYLNESKNKFHSWLGFNGAKDGIVNNWNTYCNMQSLMAFLLVDDNQEEILKALEKCCASMDNYLDYVSLDGACEEGPSYWNMAGAKVYDFAVMMKYASEGKFDVVKDEQIRKMCTYKADVALGDGWVVNFADGLARENEDGNLVYRMGKDTGEPNLMSYGLLCMADAKQGKFVTGTKSDGVFRTLETLKHMPEVLDDQKSILEECGGDFNAAVRKLGDTMKSSFYANTQIATLRNGNGWVLAAKGGHNKESHNHNDVGSAILFVNNCPVFIDMGCGLYSSKTFSKDRYTLDENRSDWHNLPTINGKLQLDGRNYAAKGTECDTEACRFSTNIAGAYDKDAACRKWVRTYSLETNKLTVTDEYELSERKAADDVHFVVYGEPEIKGGKVLINTRTKDGKGKETLQLSYPKNLKASIETKEITDERHHKVWGDKLYRLVFTSKSNAPVKGTYNFIFEKAK